MIRFALLGLLALLLISPALSAHPAWGFVVTGDGAIIFSDLEHVWQIGADGSIEKLVPDVHTHNLQLDEKGRLYGTDQDYDEPTDVWSMMLWRRGVDGTMMEIIPWVTDFREFGGNNFVVDRDGSVLHPHEATLLRRSADGSSSEATPFTFGRISTIAGDQTGNIYVADTVGNGSVFVVRPDGTTEQVMTDVVGGEPKNPPMSEDRWTKFIGLSVSADRLYASNWGSRRVVTIDTVTGVMTELYRSMHPWFPMAYTEADGHRFILEVDADAGTLRIVADTSSDGTGWIEIYDHATRTINPAWFTAETERMGDEQGAVDGGRSGDDGSGVPWGVIGVGGVVVVTAIGLGLYYVRRRRSGAARGGRGSERLELGEAGTPHGWRRGMRHCREAGTYGGAVPPAGGGSGRRGVPE